MTSRIPVSARHFVSMRPQHEYIYESVHHSRDVARWDTPQSGIHGECLSASHLVYQGVKLGAVTHVGLYLGVVTVSG